MVHIIPSYKNKNGYVDSLQYHKTQNTTWRIIVGKFICLCSVWQWIHHQEPHKWRVILVNTGALCGRQIISKNLLNRYSKRSTGKNTYFCTVCVKRLISMNHIKRHIKSLDREFFLSVHTLWQCNCKENKITKKS